VDGDTKTLSSERDSPMGKVLAHYLREWHKQTPYGRPTDFVSDKKQQQGSNLFIGILPRSLTTSS
jgi:hypothetical protein